MGSQKAEVVMDAIHSFIEEMNQVIDDARVMRSELQKYRNLLSGKIGPDFFIQHAEDMGQENKEQHGFESPIMQRRDRVGSLAIPIPSFVNTELHEINSAVERSMDLKEQFDEPNDHPLRSSTEEIAASTMLDPTMIQTSPTQKQQSMDLDSISPRSSISESMFTRQESASTQKDPFLEDSPNRKQPKQNRVMARLRKLNGGSKKDLFAPQDGMASSIKQRTFSYSMYDAEDQGKPEESPSRKILKDMKRFAAKNIVNRRISGTPKTPKCDIIAVVPKKQPPKMSETEARGLISRNTRLYQRSKSPSLQKGIERMVSDLPELTCRPKIKSFVGQIPEQSDYYDTGRIIEQHHSSITHIDGPKKEKAKVIFSCESNFIYFWDVIIFAFSIYMAIVIPLQLSLLKIDDNVDKTVCKVVGPFVDTIYVMDIALKLRTSFLTYVKEEIMDLKQIQRRYLHSTTFIVDVCAAIPWASLVSCVTLFKTPLGILAFCRILKIIGESYWNKIKVALSKSTHQNPAILRMIGIVLLFCLVAHLLACAYAYNRFKNNFSGHWAFSEDGLDNLASMSLAARYFEAMYISLSFIAGNDQGPTAMNEHQFGILGLVISFVVNAAIIGIATNVVSQMDTTAVAQKEQIDAVSDYLRYRRVPLKLYNKIISYYSYLWDIGQSSHSETLFKELPDKLKLELIVTLNKKLIQSVPLFTTCSPAGVIMLVKRLIPSIILPFELIIKEGERANSMFFLNRGSIRCYNVGANGRKMYLATLRDGSFFGEVSIVEDNLYRTANVKAYSFCELQTLMSNDFKAVLKAFPDFHEAVGKVARVRQLLSRRLSKVQESTDKNANQNLRLKLRKIVNARMFIKEPAVHPEEEEEDTKLNEVEETDFYKAILENQRQMTRLTAENAMQKKDTLNEEDFVQFEQAVNSKYEKEVKALQSRHKVAVALSVSAFADIHKTVEEKQKARSQKHFFQLKDEQG